MNHSSTDMNETNDNYDLQRFVEAQRDSYADAIAELRNGKKRSHWMWFIFPQVAGLGSSMMAQRYAIKTRGEGSAYLAHPILGPRLLECANALLLHKDKSAEEVMGYPDYLKLQSSMTLFAALSAPDSPFHKALDQYYSGASDIKTIEFLKLRE